jgi:hypothetical protein
MNTNEKAGMYAIVGGVLMLLAGVTGAATWNALGDMAVEITNQESFRLVFQVMALIGSLGGLVVILGGLIIAGKIARKEKRVPVGKVLIAIGAGFGLIGLIIFLAITLLGDNPAENIMAAMSLGFIGLVLSIVARQKAQK